MVKKEIIAMLFISVFLISSCEVYDTLYSQQADSVEVSEEDILLEDIFQETSEDKPRSDDVIIVEETELVSLIPSAEDPDQDELFFTFTSPLDDNGEWLTTYGDAGEYTITVTASDGSLTASKEILVIVSRKEEAPVIDSMAPSEIMLVIDETQSILFNVLATDLNQDDLSYVWKLDGIDIGTDSEFEYQTTFEDSGSHTLKVSVSDNVFLTENIWSVTVNNVNRKPILEDIEDFDVRETETVVIQLDAIDLDGDGISYSINDERFESDGNAFTWETTYDDSGVHTVTVSVFDGEEATTQEVIVNVQNVNRPPVILDILQKE
jgi:hypothetical protein